MRPTLHLKIFALAAGVTLATSATLAWTTLAQHRRDERDLNLTHGRHLARMVARNEEISVYGDDRDALSRLAEGALLDSGVAYLEIRDRDGRVLIQASREGVTPPVIAREELLAAGVERVVRRAGEGRPYDEILVPVESIPLAGFGSLDAAAGPVVVGHVRLGLGTPGDPTDLVAMVRRSGLDVALPMLSGLLAAFLLARRLTGPLRRLLQATRWVVNDEDGRAVEVGSE